MEAEAGRPSFCDPHRARIAAKLDAGLSAQRIYQDLVAEVGFSGSYQSVKRFVRQLRRQQHRSQDELSVWLRAFHAPITRDMIANWETGRAVVPAFYIPVLAYALKVEVADILPRLTLRDLKAGQIMPVFRRPRGRPPTHL